MSKRTLFTTVTPLPDGLTREAAIGFLHNHLQMIDLNPLVIERHRIPPPPHAPDEELGCIWYSLTDKVAGLPTDVSYTCAFHDLARGLQTHSYAPMGVQTRSKWSIGGSEPGEPAEPAELGLGAPTTGLYLREDVDLRCNILMTGFVKKTIKKSHGTLVETLARLAAAAKKADGSGGGNNANELDGNGIPQPQPHHHHHHHHHHPQQQQQPLSRNEADAHHRSSNQKTTTTTTTTTTSQAQDVVVDRPLPPTPPDDKGEPVAQQQQQQQL